VTLAIFGLVVRHQPAVLFTANGASSIIITSAADDICTPQWLLLDLTL